MKLPQITQRDSWATLQGVIDALSIKLGSPPWIDLAATAENKKADRFVSLSADKPRGLFDLNIKQLTSHKEFQSSWAWLNPPYSRGNLPLFTAWAAKFAESGGVLALCVPASMSSGWWQKNVRPWTSTIYIPTRRVNFIPPEGVRASSNAGDNVIAIMTSYPTARTTLKYLEH